MAAAAGHPSPRQPRLRSSAPSPVTVEWFFDFSSPYAYLASTQVERVVKSANATLVYRPILLGALFKQIGTPNAPLLAISEQRRRYGLKDLNDWAAWWGVPFQFNEHFPIRTVTAGRVALADPSTIPCLFAATWAQNRNLGDEAELSKVLQEAGFPAAELLTKAQSAEVKEQLRLNTEAAHKSGICGVPSFKIGDEVHTRD